VYAVCEPGNLYNGSFFWFVILKIIKMHCKITSMNFFFAAVVDLNGRFFGGRQVKAGFYSWEKLNNLELLD
jgi:hypothetical protein